MIVFTREQLIEYWQTRLELLEKIQRESPFCLHNHYQYQIDTYRKSIVEAQDVKLDLTPKKRKQMTVEKIAARLK